MVELPSTSYADQKRQLEEAYTSSSAQYDLIGIYNTEPKQVVPLKMPVEGTASDSEPAAPPAPRANRSRNR